MKIFTVILLVALTLTACSGLWNNTRIHLRREETLLQAGFKPVPLNTNQEQQLQALHQLHAGKITIMQRHGKTYYVYPDLAHHRILVGRNRQFMQYNQLVAKELTPIWKKTNQQKLEWEESGVWDNMKGWESVGWDNPSFLAY